MKVKSLALDGVKVLSPLFRRDERGYFAEIFRQEQFFSEIGPVNLVQENESLSMNVGTIRGLHFQSPPHAQGKLVRCNAGAIFDVAVDIRHGSSTFGQWVSEVLTPENGFQMWIPSGFAHGFCTLEPGSVVSYKVSDYYCAESDRGIAWDDPDINVAWPDLADPSTLSSKDKTQPLLCTLPHFFELDL
ncbi:dTDP-4-dehydrorhamnose 3,5-epimerase [Novosphingobium sp. B1]|uniref:dTDP-4-dehydrorhamnose 3,5-epimerase n=1 Tax=Novosphingobium sp. B1 TaxID=1938756 RepID=UPI000A07674B|nr:dTDP-4-dehydrorhamnose 3,5-epimerase [Novosphingobium sp. B1]